MTERICCTSVYRVVVAQWLRLGVVGWMIMVQVPALLNCFCWAPEPSSNPPCMLEQCSFLFLNFDIIYRSKSCKVKLVWNPLNSSEQSNRLITMRILIILNNNIHIVNNKYSRLIRSLEFPMTTLELWCMEIKQFIEAQTQQAQYYFRVSFYTIPFYCICQGTFVVLWTNRFDEIQCKDTLRDTFLS